MSLVEALMALGVASLMGGMISSLMLSQIKGQKYVENKSSRTDLGSSVGWALRDSQSCAQALKISGAVVSFGTGAPAASTTLDEISVGTVPVAKVSAAVTGARVSDIKLTYGGGASDLGIVYDFTPIWDATYSGYYDVSDLVQMHKYATTLEVTFDNLESPAQTSVDINLQRTFTFPVILTLFDDGSANQGRIAYCYNDDQDREAACTDMGGKWDEASDPRCLINKLGIGIRNPTSDPAAPTSPRLLMTGPETGVAMATASADLGAIVTCSQDPTTCSTAGVDGAFLTEHGFGSSQLSTSNSFLAGNADLGRMVGQIPDGNGFDLAGLGVAFGPTTTNLPILTGCRGTPGTCPNTTQGSVFGMAGFAVVNNPNSIAGVATGEIMGRNATNYFRLSGNSLAMGPVASQAGNAACASAPLGANCAAANGGFLTNAGVAVGDAATYFLGTAGALEMGGGGRTVVLNPSGLTSSGNFAVNSNLVTFLRDVTVNGTLTAATINVTLSATMNTLNLTMTPTTFPALNVTGAIFCANAISSSDERLKSDVTPLDQPLANLMALHGVSYQLRSEAKSQVRQIGLIAQQVKSAFPEAVVENQDGFLSVNYQSLIAPIIESIRQLFAKQQTLEAKVEKIELQMQRYSQTIERQKKVMAKSGLAP